MAETANTVAHDGDNSVEIRSYDPDEEGAIDRELPRRDKDYSQYTSLQEEFTELYDEVVQAFDDKSEQNDLIRDYWDIWHCKLGPAQAYTGETRAYIPAVRTAVEARVTRATNVLFPKSGRHVEITSPNVEHIPAIAALLDHYVFTARLKAVVPSLLRAGDVEGQLSVYVDWNEVRRESIRRVQKMVETPLGEDPTNIYETIIEEDVLVGDPMVEVLTVPDLAVLPLSSETIEDADIVAIARRWTKTKLRKMISSGRINKAAGKELLKSFGADNRSQQPNPDKQKANDAGVQSNAKGTKHALVYEVWHQMKLPVRNERTGKLDRKLRSTVTILAGPATVLSCRQNPYWNNRIPVISTPLKKVPGSFWGMSAIEPVKALQYLCNDYANLGFDSAMRSLNPIVLTDPEANPRWGTMQMATGAVWAVKPSTTEVINFPQLFEPAAELVGILKNQIMDALSVNPSMIPSTGSKAKPSQAAVAQEQAVALESTADYVNTVESGLMSPLVERFLEYDQQFRDEAVQVKLFGDEGAKANLISIEPFQFGERYEVRWYGSEFMRGQQDIQQQIQWANVLLAQQGQFQQDGKRINLARFYEEVTEKVMGPRIARVIIEDVSDKNKVDPEFENEMMRSGITTTVHPGDDFQKHVAIHMQLAQNAPDEVTRSAAVSHIREHITDQQKKAMQAQAAKGDTGAPGGAGPGRPGVPRPGAVPAGPRPGQQPPGALPQNGMQDPGAMPRSGNM